MDHELNDIALFENEDWRLSASGLEHKVNGYFIAADQISDRRGDGTWSWPAHMSEKLWCRPRLFERAFAEAVRAFGLHPQGSRSKEWARLQRPDAAESPSDLETAPRRLGEIAARQLAPMGDKLMRGAETSHRPRTEAERVPVETSVAAERPMRRAA